MARRKSLVTMIEDLVREQVEAAFASMLGTRAKSKRRARGMWRPGGPGRPPKAVAARRARRKK